MDKSMILKRVISAHNLLAQISVSGDNTILMADALKEMRSLAHDLQMDIADKDKEKSGGK